MFQFAEEIQELQFNDNDILVSYDVSALFTNVPQGETIQIFANKAFSQNWFNETHNLKISQDHLVELLRVATETSTFPVQYCSLYEQIDSEAMRGLGPLIANTFICFIAEKLESENEIPQERKHGRHVNCGKGHSNSYRFTSNTK